MKRNFITLLLATMVTVCCAQTASVSGKDGKLKLTFDINGGKPVYSVSYDGKQVIDPSPLGFEANIGDYASGIQFQNAEELTVDEQYELNRAKRRFCHFQANGLKVNLCTARGQRFAVRFLVSDNDIAFRYEVLYGSNDTKRRTGTKEAQKHPVRSFSSDQALFVA